MSWTFSHPAAVLPLRRFCPKYLNFAALVVGSAAPDLGHYLFLPELSRLAHTLPGTVLADLPTGLALLAVLSLLRKPLWFMLPQPHRDALASLGCARLSFRPGALLVAGVSVWLGAWTHIAWDSFTHRDGWAVVRLAPLQEMVRLVGVDFPIYYLLQQLSTIVGATVLVLAYWLWLRRAARPSISMPTDDRWRYALLTGMVAASLAVAIPFALEAIKNGRGFYAFRVFVFNLAVCSTATFLSLLALASVLFYFKRFKAMP